MIKIINVVGARPNFMKIAPLQREMEKFKDQIEYKLVHTGQHYDKNMSGTFFKDLNISEPDYYLGVGSGSHAEQTGKVMIEFERVLLKQKPDLIIVVGDVNSTIACALVAVKMNIKVAHIEAGCRSFDRTMPEEINRILTDSISDYLFAIDEESVKNLKNEGIEDSKIHLVGDIMIDSLEYGLSKIKNNNSILKKYNLKSKDFCVLTLHRPSNVDKEEHLENIFKALGEIQEEIKILFPIHPRTLKNIKKFKTINNMIVKFRNLAIIEPLGYIDFVNLFSKSKFVITDSGSLQQETSYLNIPCLTLRKNTERPITISKGTNVLAGRSREKILKYWAQIKENKFKKAENIQLWDGKTSKRIVKKLLESNKENSCQ